MLRGFRHTFQSLRWYSAHPRAQTKQKTIKDIQSLYRSNVPISVLTAHDYITGLYANDSANCDVVLVGDSLAMLPLGYATTVEMSFEEFYYQCKAVCRAIDSKFLMVDMPYGSYETGLADCVRNAIKLMKLGKVQSLKIEGSFEYEKEIKKLVEIGIPVTGHIGLKPQRFNSFSGFKVQGNTQSSALEIYKEALFLQDAGCSFLVLEAIPSRIASYITSKLDIPTIGIGAGNRTSGQVLVQGDVLGMMGGKPPKFVKQYEHFRDRAAVALNEYGREVKERTFPEPKVHNYIIKHEEYEMFVEEADKIKV